MKDKSFQVELLPEASFGSAPSPGYHFSGPNAKSLEGLSDGCQVTNWQAVSSRPHLAVFPTPVVPLPCKPIFWIDFISALTGDPSLEGGLTLIELMRLIYKTGCQIINLQRDVSGERTEKLKSTSAVPFIFRRVSYMGS